MSDIVILPPGSGPAPRTRGPWWVPLIIGVVLVALGLGLLLWPFTAATTLLAILLGAMLISSGVGLIARSGGGGAALVLGLLGIVGGILAILFPEVAAGALVTFAGVLLILLGGVWLVFALALGGGRSAWLLLPGLLLLGGILALVWPAAALSIGAIVAGLCALVVGGLMIAAALAQRRS